MKVVVKETREVVCEVVTNSSMTLHQALDTCGFDAERWCREHGWEFDNFSADECFEMDWDD